MGWERQLRKGWAQDFILHIDERSLDRQSEGYFVSAPLGQGQRARGLVEEEVDR